MNPELIAHAAELISQADALVIAAGAGMGVDSGLPDFRGNTGLWKAYPALAKAGLDFTRIASPRTFDADPTQAWGFYGHRLGLYRNTVPHEGFAILRRWSERMTAGAFVFTSNVDGQFQRAGFPDSEIYECHGSIHSLQCTRPCSEDIWTAGALNPVVENDSCRWLGELPTCPRCDPRSAHLAPAPRRRRARPSPRGPRRPGDRRPRGTQTVGTARDLSHGWRTTRPSRCARGGPPAPRACPPLR